LSTANLSHRRKAPVWHRALLAALVTALVIAAATMPAAHADTAGSLAAASAAYDKGDYATALADWRSLAAHGVAEAQHNLGVMYAKGEGVHQDYAEAASWFRKAAAQGDAEAQFGLGALYFEGEGVRQDYAEAVS